MKKIAEIHLTPVTVRLNGSAIVTERQGEAMLTELYKRFVSDYPKYYKMDPLSRLGFIASELLLQHLDEEHFVDRDDRAIVMVNRSASLAADQRYELSIQPGDDYYPSPSDFVYTLPNIVNGEIAIRHHLHGETTFVVIEEADEIMMEMLIREAFEQPQTKSVLGGWLECTDENNFEAKLAVYAIENEINNGRIN